MKTLVFVGPNATPDVKPLVDAHDRSILFEPHRPAYLTLCDMFFRRPDVHIYPMACGERLRLGWLHTYNGGLSSSLGTVTEEAVAEFTYADLELKGRSRIPIVHLGGYMLRHRIDHIATLMIDAQGMDLAILKTVKGLLTRGAIDIVRAEADALGFRHYDGLPDNSIEGHREFMSQFGYREWVMVSCTNPCHRDIQWEVVRECTDDREASGSLERVPCGA